MKRLYAIIFMGLSLLAASSCTKQEVQPEGSVITVKASDLKIPAKGGDATIEFITEVPFNVTVDKDWCEVSVNGLVATFTAKANESFESRYAKVTVTAGDETLEFTIQQFGYYTSGFEPGDIWTSSEAATFNFPYEYNDVIVATTEADWITLTVTEDNLRVDIAENTVEGTPENPARYAEINWRLGYDSGIIKVTQNNVSFMKVDSNWNVHYDGVKDWQGEDAAYISNDVTDPEISGKYAIYYTTKAEFTASGVEMNDFATVVADQLREEIYAAIDYYNQFGYNLTFSDLLYEDSDFEIFEPMDPGDYIAFAIGYADDAAATGHYAYSEFTVKGGGSATGYEAWLGEWETKRGTTTDKWTIVANGDGKTYTITGIEGREWPVTATYLSTTSGIEVRAQADIVTVSLSDYGECSVGLYGGWGASSFATGTYAIFTGSISGNTATLTPETVSFSDGSSYELERVQFVATTSEGKYLTLTQTKTPLPTTLTRVGGGEGGGDGSVNYNKFLGSWSVNGGAFTMKLSQNKADQSYWMRGWQMEEDFFEDVNATFESDGSLVLYGNSDVPFASNVDIGAPEGPCDMYYVGKFIYTDGKEYYITFDGDYDVAIGTMQANGSITFTGSEVTLSAGGTFTYNRMEIIAVPISDPDGGVYTFQNKPGEFPLTATKAGSSSVKQAGSRTGVWTKTSMRTLAAMPGTLKETYGFCTPYQALPDIPVTYRKHISKN